MKAFDFQFILIQIEEILSIKKCNMRCESFLLESAVKEEIDPLNYGCFIFVSLKQT